MPAVLGTALLIVVASFVAGRVLLFAFGRRRPTWLSGAVGLAALVVLAPLLIRLPGRATTAAVLLGVVLIGSLLVMRRKFFAERADSDERAGGRSQVAGGGELRAPRAPHLATLVTVVIVGIAACLPFLFNERVGVLGEGIYTNDQAAQLYWTDWLQHGFGPEPSAVRFGYPVGPQAMTAVAAETTGASLEHAFDGLLVAIPVLAALAALAALGELGPPRRVVAASVTAMPYLAASFLAQSAFKETAMALFVLAFAIALGEFGRAGVPRRATVAALAALAAASVFTYSLPGLIWFAVALPLWLALELIAGRRPINFDAARAAIVRHRWVAVIAALVVIAVIMVGVGPAASFVSKIGKVQASAGRLSSPLSPGEALGIWPEGDFRLVRGEVSGSIPAAAFAFVCVALGLFAAWRRRDTALVATVVASAAIYAGARVEASIYVQAKALAVMAPLLAFVALRGLFAWAPAVRANKQQAASSKQHSERGGCSLPAARWSGPSWVPTAAIALGVLFAIGAAISTFLALRDAPVSFDRRGDDLATLAARIDGKGVIFLGLDRFAAYRLRGTLVQSPGGYVPPQVKARRQKPWRQGEPVDFDTVSPHKLDRYRYAITTDAAYQSTAPPNFHEVARADGYLLWKRTGKTPVTKILRGEDGASGVVLDCRRHPPHSLNGVATVLPKPLARGPVGWSQPLPFDAPASATRRLRLGPGRWRLSLQYDSQVPLTVRAGGNSTRLPPSLDGMYLTHQGQGAYWAAGLVTLRRPTRVRIAVDAPEPSSFQRFLGARRQVWLGGIAATKVAPPRKLAIGDACGQYVDHYALAD
jgi:hypothetical protein